MLVKLLILFIMNILFKQSSNPVTLTITPNPIECGQRIHLMVKINRRGDLPPIRLQSSHPDIISLFGTYTVGDNRRIDKQVNTGIVKKRTTVKIKVMWLNQSISVKVIVIPQKLRWHLPITEANFPELSNSKIVNKAKRQRIENRTIGQIISSVVIVRDDNKKCSSCHYRNTHGSRYYRPDVEKNSTTNISPIQPYNYNDSGNGQSTWAGAGGFADRFLQRHVNGKLKNPPVGRKSLLLRKLIKKWKSDGYLP
ncbi:MAG: hypothetical protein D6813_07590 [Calditrichaeota bacterium]|nr:MAG: hypothetical protein D6813_07590 [Calditrichota bacterium]